MISMKEISAFVSEKLFFECLKRNFKGYKDNEVDGEIWGFPHKRKKRHRRTGNGTACKEK